MKPFALLLIIALMFISAPALADNANNPVWWQRSAHAANAPRDTVLMRIVETVKIRDAPCPTYEESNNREFWYGIFFGVFGTVCLIVFLAKAIT
jgi:hypothetical protein